MSHRSRGRRGRSGWTAVLTLTVALGGCAIPLGGPGDRDDPRPAGPKVELGSITHPDGRELSYTGYRTVDGGICVESADGSSCQGDLPRGGVSGWGMGSDGVTQCFDAVTGPNVAEVRLMLHGEVVARARALPGGRQLGVAVFAGCFEDEGFDPERLYELVGFDATGGMIRP